MPVLLHPFLNNLVRARAARILILAALLFAIPDRGNCTALAQPGFHKLFHLVGIPGLRRDERVDLVTDGDAMLFQTGKVQYPVPYARIRQVLFLNADRRYEGRTYAAAVATYGLGSLLILKKHHVETIVLDYVNERGGKMGLVIQTEVSQGEELKKILQSRGVAVAEPEAASDSLSPDTHKQ